jgi:hypothetical protein
METLRIPRLGGDFGNVMADVGQVFAKGFLEFTCPKLCASIARRVML